MPPTNAVDQAYADGIDRFSQAIGYEAAYCVLERSYLELTDATLRQAFHIDGALMKDFVAIVARHEDWSIRFIPGTSEIEIKRPAGAPGDTDERDEIARELNAAFDKWNKLPGIPGIRDAFKLTFEER